MLYISSAFDIGSDQNISRFYFWLNSIEHFLNYDVVASLFGDYGFILREEGGTENDFLRMLLDNGIAGACIYVVAIGLMAWKAVRRRDWAGLSVVALIIVSMNIFPFVQSLSSSLLFWLYAFSYCRETNKISLRSRRTLFPHVAQDHRGSIPATR